MADGHLRLCMARATRRRRQNGLGNARARAHAQADPFRLLYSLLPTLYLTDVRRQVTGAKRAAPRGMRPALGRPVASVSAAAAAAPAAGAPHHTAVEAPKPKAERGYL
eukprot:scaffold1208_cov113-Isochrysis_galbana.AAC.3